MKAAAEAVIRFNREVIGIQPRPLAPMAANEADHLTKCLAEEIEEFRLGSEREDVVECVDALIDSIYFALGGLYKMGLTAEQIGECFQAIQEANMTKKRGVVQSRAVEGAGDATKPDGWLPPEKRIAAILFETE